MANKYLKTKALLTAIFLISVFLAPVFAVASLQKQLFPVSWAGFDAISKNDYESALKDVLADTIVKDTIHRYFKLGCIHQKLKNHSKALFFFKLAAQKDSFIAPVSFEHIAEIEKELGNKTNVTIAYGFALGYQTPKSYRQYLFKKIRSGVESDTIDLSKCWWLNEYNGWLSKQVPIKKSTENQFDSLLKAGTWKQINLILDTLSKGSVECSIVEQIFKGGADSLHSKNLLLLARTALSCKKYDLAKKIAQSISERKDSVALSKSDFLYFLAQLSYDSGRFEDAINQFKKHQKLYGSTSEGFMYIARAYRKLKNAQESSAWYDKHVRSFPQHPKTQEIIWLRAWQREEAKNYKGAAEYFKKLYTLYSKGSRGEESYIRHALCFYRTEQYDSAIIILDKFKNKYPGSNFLIAADYWKAKCLFSSSKVDAAKKLFFAVSQLEPYDYYAHRSRQTLTLLGDTINFVIDSVYDVQKTAKWLDSISPANSKKVLSFEDSINYDRGLLLITSGQSEKADHFLELLENNFPGNLEMQYELALMYSIADAPMQSYRIARRLTWRVPQQFRSNLPLSVYALLYPSFFDKPIRNYGNIHNVDPFLVSSVIRQESIFNAKIVSPVGAVGLMQIMPYTGKYIADKLGEGFDVDSLWYPIFNIRYGIFYLRDLLAQFNENIVMAIASYNGGPHNVLEWYERNKDEEYDLFIEDLAFTETRGYVKRVLGNYWTYQFLSKNPGLRSSVPLFETLVPIAALSSDTAGVAKK